MEPPRIPERFRMRRCSGSRGWPWRSRGVGCGAFEEYVPTAFVDAFFADFACQSFGGSGDGIPKGAMEQECTRMPFRDAGKSAEGHRCAEDAGEEVVLVCVLGHVSREGRFQVGQRHRVAEVVGAVEEKVRAQSAGAGITHELWPQRAASAASGRAHTSSCHACRRQQYGEERGTVLVRPAPARFTGRSGHARPPSSLLCSTGYPRRSPASPLSRRDPVAR